MVELFVEDDDFYMYTRAWPKLQTFKLWQAYWPTYKDSDEEDEDLPYAGIPTPDVLDSFRCHCPGLRVLTLPYLDLNAEVAWWTFRGVGLDTGRSVCCSERDLGYDSEEEEDAVRGMELEDDKVDEWARYILPKLDANYSHIECGSVAGWREVFRRVGDIHKSQKGSLWGSAVMKVSKY